MTSKISSRKLIRQDMKQRSWLWILIFIVGIMMLPVALQLTLNVNLVRATNGLTASTMTQVARTRIVENAVTSILGTESILLPMGAVVAAFLSAMSGFAWLHSREQVDFYHSTAVRRSTLFRSFYVSGILLVAIPFIVDMLIAIFLVPALHHGLTGTVIRIGMIGMLYFLLCFTVIYTFCVLGMMLAGRMLTGMILAAVLLLYVPLCDVLIRLLTQTFFSTVIMGDLAGPARFASPVMIMFTHLEYGEGSVSAACWLALIGLLIVSLILNMVVYRHRKSETAGSALTFRWMNVVLKVLLAVPGGVIGGLIFSLMGGSDKIALVVGAILCTVLISGVIELIYTLDIRNVLKHWASGVVSIVVAVFIGVFFLIDPFGIDHWMPAEEQVEAMAVSSDEFVYRFTSTGYLLIESRNKSDQYLTDFDAFYELAETAVEQLDEEPEYSTYVTISYLMKNGKTYSRNYFVDAETFNQALAAADSPEFREKYYPEAYVDFSVYDHLDVSAGRDASISESETLSEADAAELAEALHNDAVALAPADYLDTKPVATLYLYREDKDDDSYGYSMDYWPAEFDVLPEFEETIAWLEAHGHSDVLSD